VIEIGPLWDYSQPEASEQRFRAALAGAQGDDVLILQTQIARTYSLRRDFARAREILQEVERALPRVGHEARTRYWLELGRTYASGVHPRETQTPDALETARGHFQHALEVARAGQLDGLEVDAIHMMAMVDTAPTDQLKWGREALAVLLASEQPAARRWEGSIRNNIGCALHGLGRYAEALEEFEQALVLRQASGNAEAIHAARWMIAWTLRALRREDEALAIQLALEQEAEAAGRPDPCVFEELELLYRARGEADRAAHYARRREAARQ
jgi:tetratricopeptide (TPR) repeat protein